MSDFKLRASPARFAAVSAVICGLGISVFCSLLQGRGHFVWNWEIAAVGGIAAIVGALRGWKDAKEFRDAGARGAEPCGGTAGAAQAPSKVILREELHQNLIRAAQVRSILTMLSVIPTLAVAFGATLLVAQLGAPAVVTEIIFIPLLFGPPLIVGWTLTERYCKSAASCPHCRGSLWSCGSGNFKPRRMKVRYDAKACPHCGAPIV